MSARDKLYTVLAYVVMKAPWLPLGWVCRVVLRWMPLKGKQ